jgi:hypothetical protein
MTKQSEQPAVEETQTEPRTPAYVKIAAIQEKIDSLQDEILLWEQVIEAKEGEKSPYRDRIVVRIAGEYHATHRYSVNEYNGFVTVQLRDGSILPTRLGQWALWNFATDQFDIAGKDIKIDDPDAGG